MATLPYITAPGGIEKALIAIKSASTPASVSQDFVKTILGVKGGTGNQVTSFLKKIGFAASDGKPTEIYTKFRNPTTSGAAAAAALRHGYAALYNRNEFFHDLSDEELKGLITEETGAGDDSSVPPLVFAAISAIKKHATFESGVESAPIPEIVLPKEEMRKQSEVSNEDSGVGLNLSYTINLNLPATSDIAVFNAIFKSLKENLLRG